MTRLTADKVNKLKGNLRLYYHDNGAWILYNKKTKRIVGEGGGEVKGYIPDIVKVFCDVLNIEVESA